MKVKRNGKIEEINTTCYVTMPTNGGRNLSWGPTSKTCV